MKPGRIVMLVVGLGLIGGLAYWLRPVADTPHYLTSTARTGTVIEDVLANGVIEPSQIVSVGAQVSGRIVKLHADVGDRVKAGALLAEIDSLPQRNAVSDANANLTAYKAERAAQLARLKQAEQADTRQQALAATRAGSPAAAENTRAALDAARADLARLDAQITRGQIALDRAKLDLEYTKVKAPITGVIVATLVEEGRTVNAQQQTPTLMKIAVIDPLSIRVEIAEADVIAVKPGTPLTFALMGDPETQIPSRLSSIDPATDSVISDSGDSGNEAIYFTGRFDVKNVDGRLKPGMSVTVRFILDKAENVIVIPSAAVIDTEKGRFVRVLKNNGTSSGVVEMRAVTIGLDNRSEAEVKSGLAIGETVITGEAVAAQAQGMQRPPMRL